MHNTIILIITHLSDHPLNQQSTATGTETMEHGCDVLAVDFRPDGKEVCAASVNGNVYTWDVDTGDQKRCIEGRRDIGGGKIADSAIGSKANDNTKCFTCVSYTADGSCILAGGRSKYACVYTANSGTLVKKFQLSFNRSLEGIIDEVSGRGFVDGVHVDSLRSSVAGGALYGDEHLAASTLPGAGKGSDGRDGSRTTRPELVTQCLRFSPTGRDWAAATTQGMQIFSVDPALLFVPLDLDMAVTPQAVKQAIATQQFPTALTFALQLGEGQLLRETAGSIPVDAVEMVVRALDTRLLSDLMRFLADELSLSKHVEFYLQWCSAILAYFGPYLQQDSVPYQASLRSLIRAVGSLERETQRAADDNLYTLAFLETQRGFLALSKEASEGGKEGEGEEEQQGGKGMLDLGMGLQHDSDDDDEEEKEVEVEVSKKDKKKNASAVTPKAKGEGETGTETPKAEVKTPKSSGKKQETKTPKSSGKEKEAKTPKSSGKKKQKKASN